MSEALYTLVPMMSLVMAVFGFTMRIYKRSVSSFISILMVAVSSNLIYYGHIDAGLIAIIVLLMIMFFRSIIKPENDSFIVKRYDGVERRKC